MAIYNYFRYKIRIAPDSEKRQGLAPGDIVRRQYTDRNQSIYSLMVVLETGEDRLDSPAGIQISPFFVGALLEGDEPRDGELLDFVRVSNLFDPERSGSMYLTASDAESPFMDVLDDVGTGRSLCLPAKGGYGFVGSGLLTGEYMGDSVEASRIFRLTKTSQSNDALMPMGFSQRLEHVPPHPARLIFSYKIRASRPCSDVCVVLRMSNEGEWEAQQRIDLTTEWEYRLFVVTVDYPERLARDFIIDLQSVDHVQNDWWEIADLNIIELAAIATFADASRARVGKISGIVDPLFGLLDGYGAYFQNLYATRNVSIAGTLTAGDEDGFASTFYVGRIHKNCFINSLQPRFTSPVVTETITPPTGIGKSFQLPAGQTVVECQSTQWVIAHQGQQYCFSFWAYATTAHDITLQHGGETVGVISIDEGWKRYSLPIVIRHVAGEPLYISMSGPATRLFASPQLEIGAKPSLYQPTDGTLRETDEYGAWFNRGGVGGTIQNPLLRLNDDGSISSANNSFVINPDGTGHFAGGRFKWTGDTIELQDFTIKWEDIKGFPGPVQAFLTSNQPYTQIYNKESNTCTPSWALSPYLVLTPSLFVGSDPDDQITLVADPATGKAGILPETVVWYKNGKVITSGQNSSTIAASDKKYALTIKNNAIGTYAPQMRFTFEAAYRSAGGALIQVRAEAQFTLLLNATAVIRAVAYAPDGNVFKNGDVKTLRAHCDLWRGSVIDTKNAQYVWGVRDEAVFATTKLSKPAAKGDTVLTVYSTDNMVPGHILWVIYEPFTIASVNHQTNEVTLTTPQTGSKAVNCLISCPDYNASLGPGWFPLSAENPRGTVAGWGTNEITLTPEAVQNYEVFKCAITDTDTNADNPSARKVVCEIISFSDQSDPISVRIDSPDGFTVKNSGTDIEARAVLLRGTEEIDPDGTQYVYQWRLYDSVGETVVRSYIGKTIIVTKGTVANKGVLTVDVCD